MTRAAATALTAAVGPTAPEASDPGASSPDEESSPTCQAVGSTSEGSSTAAAGLHGAVIDVCASASDIARMDATAHASGFGASARASSPVCVAVGGQRAMTSARLRVAVGAKRAVWVSQRASAPASIRGLATGGRSSREPQKSTVGVNEAAVAAVAASVSTAAVSGERRDERVSSSAPSTKVGAGVASLMKVSPTPKLSPLTTAGLARNETSIGRVYPFFSTARSAKQLILKDNGSSEEPLSPSRAPPLREPRDYAQAHVSPGALPRSLPHSRGHCLPVVVVSVGIVAS